MLYPADVSQGISNKNKAIKITEIFFGEIIMHIWKGKKSCIRVEFFIYKIIRLVTVLYKRSTVEDMTTSYIPGFDEKHCDH